MNQAIRTALFISAMFMVAGACGLLAARAQNPAQAGAPTSVAGQSRPTTQDAGQKSGSSGSKTASQEFKNIQILKDVPAGQLISAMQFITASLGVECEYCHVEHAFDKDDKKTKVTARKMMEMMLNINRENFEGHREVTCFTCHQGSAHPASIPAVGVQERVREATHETTVQEATRGATHEITHETAAHETARRKTIHEMGENATGSEGTKPAPESLLDQYLAAVGGADAVKKVSSRVERGSLAGFGDQTIPIEIFAKAPDKRVSVVHMKEGESVTAYNGKVGWLSVPGRVHLMNGQESAGARIDADMEFAVDVKNLYAKWETMPGEKVDGHETWLVIGHKDGVPPLKLYFDQKSNLLLRMVRYTDSPLGYNPTQIDYADYRNSEVVKIPYRW